MRSFFGKRVTVIGLGIEGVDLVRFFASHGATVTVSDAKPAASLERPLAEIADLDVALSLSGNRAGAVDGADLVAVSQGAPLDLPPIKRARSEGIPITSRTKLFFELCPGTIIGISGSSGKTTTTSLVGSIFAASGRPSLVGGNIGGPLLSRLDEVTPQTWVILEVSHSQLVLMDSSPHVACLTNVTPNHLDRFTWDEYVALKRNLLAHQNATDVAVLNRDNEITRSLVAESVAEVLQFTLGDDLKGDGALLRDGQIIWRRQGHEERILAASDVPLRGRHNLENVVCAATVAGACGIDSAVTAEAVRRFRAVPHRLEFVSEIGGASYYNDSIATAPERALAGLRSFREPIVLLLGGREKHLPVDELAVEANQRCRAIVCFGEAGELLARACRAAHPHGACSPLIRRVDTLTDAVTAAKTLARPGDIVLLSPACTSFDAYDNFERRGESFRELVLSG